MEQDGAKMSSTEHKPKFGKWFFIALSVVIALWTGTPLFIPWFISKHYLPTLNLEPGTFGDMFGAINALFSGAALCGLTYTVLLQRHQLDVQKSELEEAKTEVKYQRELLDKQTKTFELQQFEGTFFSLVALYNQNINATTIHHPLEKKTTNGIACYALYWEEIRAFYNGAREPETITKLNTMNSDQRAEHAYTKLMDNRQPALGQAFRVLFNLIKFIDESDVTKKNFYAKIIRAQLSTHELLILLFSTKSEFGKKFKPFIIKYNLFKHINLEPLGGLSGNPVDLFDEFIDCNDN